MLNNDILRSLRYSLSLNNKQIMLLFNSSDISLKTLDSYLAKDDDDCFKALPDRLLGQFLDGLIKDRRGEKPISETSENKPEPAYKKPKLTNNEILKKIRIAMNYTEQDMLECFDKANFKLSKSQLSALFRKPEHRHYKECKDQYLRAFLKGLAIKRRN